jgi:malate dehydrogenase (oxaloacetate-decarboxylating)(NADP+)
MSNNQTLYQEALELHEKKPAGKVALFMPKPLNNQRDLALAYSPGVAAPCLEIEKDEKNAFRYTSKGNMVAVISNGTAVLGLGDIGHMASKPVMEGKCVLFKRFADIDAVDIEVNTKDPKEFIEAVSRIADSWGGINLEDIKAPECFVIENELKKICKVPVFHDDQHGTAIITVAAMINALDLTGRTFSDVKIVASGAGAAAIACLDLLVKMGAKKENITICDTKGVIYKGRTDGMNEWKEKYAVETKNRTIGDAMVGADIFIGLSGKGTISQDMVRTMAPNPIIFAMANPDPEITPAEVKAVRDDAIVATGRSDYNNQVNNVMGFPYIFRGALDVQATAINDEMKIAAAKAIASIARRETTAEVEAAYSGKSHRYGPEYIIPVPFDSRLMYEVPVAVAKAAMETGVAGKPISDFKAYEKELALRLNPGGHLMYSFNRTVQNNPKTVIFAEGEEDGVIKAAAQWCNQNYGKAILVGYEEHIRESMQRLGIESHGGLEIMNASKVDDLNPYINHLYSRVQREGFLYRDCMRLIKRDRHVFAAEMLVHGLADAMVTGVTRDYTQTLDDISKVIPAKDGNLLLALSILMKRERIVFIADTAIHANPTAQQIADIAVQAADEVKKMGYTPRVALVSTSTFGHPDNHCSFDDVIKMRDALKILDSRKANFEYDGEISPEVALNSELLKVYPFCRLSGPANILVMPNINTASVSVKLLEEFGRCISIGPVISGFSKPVYITRIGANSSEVFNGAVVASSRS